MQRPSRTMSWAAWMSDADSTASRAGRAGAVGAKALPGGAHVGWPLVQGFTRILDTRWL